MELINYILPYNILGEIYRNLSWYEIYQCYKKNNVFAGSNELWAPLMVSYFPESVLDNKYISCFIKNIWDKVSTLRCIWYGISVGPVFNNKVRKFIELMGEEELCLFLFESGTESGNNTWILEYVSEHTKNNIDLIKVLIVHEHFGLKYASDALKDNDNIVKLALDKNGSNLQYASFRLKNDRELVKYAVRQNGFALHHANEKFRDDDEIARVAVTNNGNVLHILSERLRDDKEIVILAVSRPYCPTRGISKRLQNDKELVKYAVSITPSNLWLFSPKFRDDDEVISIIMQHGKDYLCYASQRLKDKFN